MENILVNKTEPTIIEDGLNWTDFFNNYWLKKPVLYRNPLGNVLITENELHGVLARYQQDLAEKKKRDIIIYDSKRKSHMGLLNSARVNVELDKLLPDGSEHDLQEYFRNLMQIESFDEFCIYINEAHNDPFIWKVVRDQLREILKFMPLPAGKVSSDFFIGNYEKTNFGAHRDPINNMMFMLFGSRTMLMWSDETWKETLGNPADNKYIALDYEEFRSNAISFTLHPGDMLYWPHHYWHVGENYGNLSGSFNLDFPLFENDLLSDEVIKRSVTDHIKELGKNLFKEMGHFDGKITDISDGITAPNHYAQLSERFEENFDAGKIENKMVSNWLVKMSSYGTMLPIKPRPFNVAVTDKLCVDSNYPILSKQVDLSLLISHSGHMIKISAAIEKFSQLISYINMGVGFTIEEISEKFADNSLPENVVGGFLRKLYSIHAISLQN